MSAIPPDYSFTIELGDALSNTDDVSVVATVVQTISVVNFENEAVVPIHHGSTHTSIGTDPVPLASIYGSGLVPYLPPVSGSGSQTHVYLRGDDTWETLPQHAYTSAAFTVPAVGSTVVASIYPETWPAVGCNVYYSDGTHRGFMDVTGATSSSITLVNRGNGNSGDVVAAMSLIKLTAPPTATATTSGLVPTPTNTGQSVLLDNAVWTPVDGYSLEVGAYTAGQLSAIRPWYNLVEIVDEFTAYQNAATVNQTVSAGPNAWWFLLPGTTAQVVNSSSGIDAFNKCVGVWGLYTPATTSSYSRMYLPGSGTLLGLGQLDIYIRFAMEVLPSSSNSGAYRMGLSDGVGTYTGNSVMLQVSYSGGSPTWSCQVYQASSAKTGTSSGITLPTISAFSSSSPTFYKLQISINPVSGASFYINGVLAATYAASVIPTSVYMDPFISVDNVSATSQELLVDKFYYRYQIAV